jgi:hypothetical protein
VIVELEPRSRQTVYTWWTIFLLGCAIGLLAVADAAGAEHERLLGDRSARRSDTLSALDEANEQLRQENEQLRARLAEHEHSEELRQEPDA